MITRARAGPPTASTMLPADACDRPSATACTVARAGLGGDAPGGLGLLATALVTGGAHVCIMPRRVAGGATGGESAAALGVGSARPERARAQRRAPRSFSSRQRERRAGVGGAARVRLELARDLAAR